MSTWSSPPSTTSSSSARSTTSASSNIETKETDATFDLHKEDLHAALVNLLYPRNCETLKILKHDITPCPGPENQVIVTYSLVVDKILQQKQVIILVKQYPITLEEQRLFRRELAFFWHIEPQLRHLLVQGLESPLPRCFLARGECDIPQHRNPSMPLHRGPPEPGCRLTGAPPFIMLQALAQDGYSKIKGSELDYHHSATGLRALARLHATSAVLDRNDPKLKRGSYLRSAFPFLVPDRGLNGSTESLFDRGMKVIATLGPQMEPKTILPGRDVRKVVRFMHHNLHALLEEILKPHPTQLNTLCHTNCTDAQEFLYLYGQRHRPIMCKLACMERVRYCRPAVDISLVLFCTANNDVRRTKLRELMEVYREEFNKTLERCQKRHHIALPFTGGLLSTSQLEVSVAETRLLGVALRAFQVATNFPEMKETIAEISLEEAATRAFLRNSMYRGAITQAVSDLLTATELYAGDCCLSSQHKDCPHFLPGRKMVGCSTDLCQPNHNPNTKKKENSCGKK